MSKSQRVCVWLFLCLPALGFAQQSPAPATPAPQAPPLISERPAPPPEPAEGRIQLDVLVTDKSGKPVSGMERSDFTLLDNNLPGKILSFHAFDEVVEKTSPPAQVVLLLDAVNEGFSEVAQERQEIEKFLRQNGGHVAQPVSILVFTNDGFKALVEPSTDGNAMAVQLEQSPSGLRTLSRSAGAYGAIERFDLSVRWITAIAREAAKRPGRKLLIWVGPGWPLLDRANIESSSQGQQHMFNSIVNLSTTLREGHIALYSVSMGMPGPGTFLYQSFLKGVKTAEKVNPPNLGLKVLAAQSGGQVQVPNSDLAGQIDSCVQDAGAFYTLSFDPPRADRANEYHDLKVQIDKPGLKARTNTGYYNQP